MVFTPGLAILVVTAALSYALAQQGLAAPVWVVSVQILASTAVTVIVAARAPVAAN